MFVWNIDIYIFFSPDIGISLNLYIKGVVTSLFVLTHDIGAHLVLLVSEGPPSQPGTDT